MASQNDLYNLAKSVGLSDSAAKTAAAVGMAESGGNQNAHNTNADTGDDSYGYWQINMFGGLGPARRKQLGITSDDQLFDPATNARAMKLISADGLNFYPWSTYGDGTYRQFLNNPVGSDGKNWVQTAGDSILSPITSPLDAVKGAVETLNKAARWVSNSENWLRVGYVTGGAVLTIAGLVMVLSSTSAGKAAMNVVPAGRVANIAKSAVKGAS